MIKTLSAPITAPKKTSKAIIWIKRIAVGIVFAVLLFLLFIFTALAADRVISKNNIPSVFGYSPLTVLTGSMEPSIYAGDMVIIKSQSEYSVGDVVTYTVNGGQASVTHQIIESYVEGGVRYFITKGTNNNAEDPNPVASSQVVGKVVLVIPDLGIFLEWLKTPSGITLIFLFACIIVAAAYIIKA